MLSRGGEIAVGLLALPTVICISVAGMNVHHEIWEQWSQKWAWVNMWAGSVHSGFILVFVAVALVNLAILLVVGVWWLLNARKPTFPHRGFAAWFVLLLISLASSFPFDEQYAAIAVLLFGPGQKSPEFQTRAAERDSTMLLNALIFRGIQVDNDVLCLAALYDSTRVINRLVERSVPVNVECNRRKATALYTAVGAKQYRSAKILVEAGAKADLPDIGGNTPLDLARRQGDERMIRILTQ
jgi:hypothetical protein